MASPFESLTQLESNKWVIDFCSIERFFLKQIHKGCTAVAPSGFSEDKEESGKNSSHVPLKRKT